MFGSRPPDSWWRQRALAYLAECSTPRVQRALAFAIAQHAVGLRDGRRPILTRPIAEALMPLLRRIPLEELAELAWRYEVVALIDDWDPW